MTKTNKAARILAESAIMIAFAIVLSLINIIKLPYGGAVTIASMLPIAIVSYRHGTGWGLLASLVYAGIQQILGLSNLSYVTGWQSILAVILLDYMIAFAVISLAGIFRKCIKNQALSVITGCLFVALLRYACHVISGATVWAGLSIPTEAALVYSFGYNATYMIPETIILLVIGAYITINIDFSAKNPTRIVRPDIPKGLNWMAPAAGLVSVIGIILDTLLVFSQLQEESGAFNIHGLAKVNWVLVCAITAVTALVALSLFAVRRALIKKS